MELAGAGGGDAGGLQHAKHAEGVEDGLVYAMGGEAAVAVKPGVAGKCKRPGYISLKVDVVVGGESKGAGEKLCLVAGVLQGVAVGVLRMEPGAGGPAPLGA